MEIELKLETIDFLLTEWDRMTYRVLDLKEISKSEMQEFLKETYRLLTDFHKSELIPKELSRLLFTIQEFLYFAELMEEKEVPEDFYNCSRIFSIVSAMNEGFYNSEYTYAFPRLNIYDTDGTEHIISFEEEIFIDK